MSDATMDPPILAALLVGHFRRMRDDRLASLRRKRNLLRMSLVVHAITDELDDAEPTCRAVVLTLPTPAKAWAASPSSCQPPPSPPPGAARPLR